LIPKLEQFERQKEMITKKKEEFKRAAEEVKARLEAVTLELKKEVGEEERRQIVESITESIVVGKDEVEVNLFYFPKKEKLTTEQRMGRGSWRRSA
jgi:ribosomal protein L9